MAAPASSITISGIATSGTGKFDTSTQPATPGTLLSRLPSLASNVVPSTGGWAFGAQSGAAISVGDDGTNKYLRGQYPIDVSGDQSGANYIFGGYTPSSLQQDIYVQFYARIPTTYKNGCKFVKFFGKVGGDSGYANATFTTETYGDQGNMQQTAYGDGTGLQNDAQNGVAFYTPNFLDSGRAGALTKVFTRGGTFNSSDWGTAWHKFQIRLRQNSGTTSGNEVNDGATDCRIDGVVRGAVTNVFNRNPANGFIETIGFFGYSRAATSVWELHMRDITVSTGGWVD